MSFCLIAVQPQDDEDAKIAAAELASKQTVSDADSSQCSPAVDEQQQALEEPVVSSSSSQQQ